MAEGARGDEPLGHALAALDARWVDALAASAVAGQEERLRRFARVFRALPAPAAGPAGARRLALGRGRPDDPVGPSRPTSSLANDTPYPIRLETARRAPRPRPRWTTWAAGSGSSPRRSPERPALVLDLLPFGVAAPRVGSPEVRVASVTPYPGPAVLDEHAGALRRPLGPALARLNRAPGGDPAGPPDPGRPNAGFEPEPVAAGHLARPRRPSRRLAGRRRAGGTAEIDPAGPTRARGASGSTPGPAPAAVVSDPFGPDGRSALTSRPGSAPTGPTPGPGLDRGQAAGQPFVRRSELTAQPDWAERGRPGHASSPPAGLTRPGSGSSCWPRAGSGSTTCSVGGEALGARAAQRPPRPVAALCRPTARSATPTSPGWPARTGPGCRPSPAPAWPPGRPTARA